MDAPEQPIPPAGAQVGRSQDAEAASPDQSGRRVSAFTSSAVRPRLPVAPRHASGRRSRRDTPPMPPPFIRLDLSSIVRTASACRPGVQVRRVRDGGNAGRGEDGPSVLPQRIHPRRVRDRVLPGSPRRGPARPADAPDPRRGRAGTPSAAHHQRPHALGVVADARLGQVVAGRAVAIALFVGPEARHLADVGHLDTAARLGTDRGAQHAPRSCRRGPWQAQRPAFRSA
jgi:hypothetical protein